ncbi:MAG: NUDIX domain-containing protein [Ancrocorticia sp.]
MTEKRNGNGLTPRQQAEVDSEWSPDADGILRRSAARVLLFDSRGRIFLIRGHDVGDTEHSWWFTVGGGIDAHEDPRDGACRELLEETGLVLSPERLLGPVLRRHATFHFVLEMRRQDEEFFIAFVDDDEAARVGKNHRLTALEKEVLDEMRWWYPHDIVSVESSGTAHATFYPRGIADLAGSLWAGWDGSCPEVWEE